jgi:hypothetical protein
VWRIIHVLIIMNFLVEVLYGVYMVFFVIGGRRWPLFAQAAQTPVEVILKRRLYAIETWIAMTGLGVYVAVTEILPRRAWRWVRDGRRRGREMLRRVVVDEVAPTSPVVGDIEGDEIVSDVNRRER